MAEIKDTGKVWVKGSVGPVYAVRIDGKVFATGKEFGQNEKLWLENDGLCLDLHNIKKGERTARVIPLNSQATLAGTLFNGFENTKHADVLIVAFDTEGAKEKIISGEEYLNKGIKDLDCAAFWEIIWNI
tara:strand:+ start:126 stop:515 length:390 start_codon:yes stop_codon:yes gene_type:complete